MHIHIVRLFIRLGFWKALPALYKQNMDCTSSCAQEYLWHNVENMGKGQSYWLFSLVMYLEDSLCAGKITNIQDLNHINHDLLAQCGHIRVAYDDLFSREFLDKYPYVWDYFFLCICTTPTRYRGDLSVYFMWKLAQRFLGLSHLDSIFIYMRVRQLSLERCLQFSSMSMSELYKDIEHVAQEPNLLQGWSPQEDSNYLQTVKICLISVSFFWVSRIQVRM